MKKKKEKNVSSMNHHDTSLPKIYRQPIYLKTSRKLLLRVIRMQLNHPLMKNREQRFTIARLKLLDRQYCIDLYRQLWQNYLDLGSMTRLWPEQVTTMKKTSDHELIQQFVTEHLAAINQDLNQCNMELTTHSIRCPSTLSIETIDIHLRRLVSLHQRRFSKKLNCQLAKFKAYIGDHDLWQELSSYQLSIDQLEAIDRMITFYQQQIQVYEELSKLEQRILCKFLPKSFDHVTIDDLNLTEKDGYMELPLKEKQKKLQQSKRTMLDHLIQAYENKIVDYEYQYQQELIQLEKNVSHNNRSDGISLVDSIKKYLTHRKNQFKRENRSKMAFFRTTLFRRRRRYYSSTRKKNIIGVWPQAIVDVSSLPLNNAEWSYICSAGPNYIRPNRTALRPVRQQFRQIQCDHDGLMNKTVSYLYEHCHVPKTSPIIKQLSTSLKDRLTLRYMAPLSLYDELRARRELRLVKSIRRKLKKHKLVLRPTDKSGVFHIGSANDYERKAIEYRSKTGAYTELSSDPLREIVDKVDHVLNDLRSKKYILVKYYDKMKPDRQKVHLAYMYFIPKAHKKDTPLRPIMNTINAPTTAISRFLDRLIRPLFDKHARATTIVDGADLVHRLNAYVADGRLKPSTLFCTFDITDLYTMLPQQESLSVLREFLIEYGYERVNGISIDTILELANLVLTENAFVYGEQIFKQIIGGAMGSPFTLTLANIFMWKWQRPLVRRQEALNEIYGRYIDDVILTSNESQKTVEKMLEEANSYHPNIKLHGDIGKCVTFLDLCINNDNGTLSTSVHHKDAAEPYVVPFKSDHPRHTFGNIIQGALLRAVRYSSILSAFNDERRQTRLMLLYNGYPSNFIDTQFKKFFSTYHTSTVDTLPLIDSENHFQSMRRQIQAIPTVKQSQVLKRAATVNSKTEPNNPVPSVNLKKLAVIRVKPWKHQLILHYMHEKRLEAFKRDFHQIWEQIFAGTPVTGVKIIVGTRNSANLQSELVRKRPKLSKLQTNPN